MQSNNVCKEQSVDGNMKQTEFVRNVCAKYELSKYGMCSTEYVSEANSIVELPKGGPSEQEMNQIVEPIVKSRSSSKPSSSSTS